MKRQKLDSRFHAKMLPYSCRKHGPQTPYVCKQVSRHGKPTFGRYCPICRKEKEARLMTSEQRIAYMEHWRNENRDRINAMEVIRRRKIKWDTIAAYGGGCECCGQTQPDFLCIDHVNRDGKKHRAAVGSSTIWRWLKDNGYPKDGFRLLCWNCNLGRERNEGVCPHEYGRLKLINNPPDGRPETV